jgi:hypothetical protein
VPRKPIGTLTLSFSNSTPAYDSIKIKDHEHFKAVYQQCDPIQRKFYIRIVALLPD